VIYIAGLLAVIVFALVLDRSGVPRIAAEAIDLSRASARTVRDRSLSDDEKERRVRQASYSLLRFFLAIAVRSVGAVGLSVLTLFAFQATGLADMSTVASWLATVQAILLASAILILWFLIRRRT